jgi:hypothetical protein
VAKPFVCPNGQMTYQQSVTNPLPGTTYTTVGWYCVDNQSETTTPLDLFQVAVPAGIIYGLVIAALIAVVVFPAWRRNAFASAVRPAAIRSHSPGSYSAPPAAPAGDSLARMKELKRLLSEQLISEAEYQKKHAEILKDL